MRVLFSFFPPPPPPPIVAAPDALREASIALLGVAIGTLACLVVLVGFGALRGVRKGAAAATKPPAAPAAPGLEPAVLQRLLESRRSVTPKDYTGGTVDEKVVRSILSAAPWAPNHGKTEPWRFVVFGGERKEALLAATLEWHLAQPASFWQSAYLTKKGPEFAGGASFAKYYREEAVAKKWSKASHLVALCLHRQRPSEKKRIPHWEELAACACAVQNMHLKATSLRVAAYWSSWYELYRKSEACVRFLGLSPEDGDQCIGVFVIGESEKLDQIRGTRLPLADVVTWR